MSVTEPAARRAGRGSVEPPGEPDAGTDGRPTRAPVEIVVLAVAALVAGVALRFVTRSPLWLDEALSVNIARLPLGDIPDELRQDGHPPLYYVLLHLWMQVAGTGDVAVRALSGLFALGALPLAWMLGRRRGGPLLAWTAVAVLALAPFALRYATETRMYALVILLVLAGWLLVDRALRDGRVGIVPLVGLAAVTALLLYSHYWAIWLLGAVTAVVGWQAWRGAVEVRSRARRVLVALVLGGVAFLPWLPVLVDQASSTGTPWAGPQRPASMVAVTLMDFGGGEYRDAQLGGAVLLVLLLLGLFGRAVDERRITLDLATVPQLRHEALVAGITLCLGAAAGYATAAAWATRYAAVFFPFVVLLVAAGVTRFDQRAVRAGVLAVVLVFGVMGGVFNVRGQRTQAGQIGDAVAAVAAPGDLVVYCPDQLGPAGDRAMPDDVRQVVYPTLADPLRVDWRDYEARNASADPAAFAAEALALAGPDAQVFVVWSPAYRTYEGQCEAVLDGIIAARGGGEVLVVEQGTEYFEHAQLVRFGAAP